MFGTPLLVARRQQRTDIGADCHRPHSLHRRAMSCARIGATEFSSHAGAARCITGPLSKLVIVREIGAPVRAHGLAANGQFAHHGATSLGACPIFFSISRRLNEQIAR
jgi:hypothetical protein